MWTTNDIRGAFLEYFRKYNHEIMPSAPLVPQHDPTLMFVNAGMVPFKNIFTGQESRPYARAVSSQKCVRAGGKHNDLDNVGYTARHHTFFEMLGNFSFGDYFKEDAITFAWEFLTGVLELPEERLLATVYHEDDEAYDLWRRLTPLPEARILRIATQDNFWSMGATGPCGPCSEIFYDHGPDVAGGPPGSAEENGDRFTEIWNLVFMQYEQKEDGSRTPLPRPCVDTGMGLERIAAVLQGVHDNYDTDTFRHLIAASVELSGAREAGAHATSHRVIADHLRASCFLLADGVLPSNEGRGYVLRRIMRRAMRHVHQLGCDEPLMYRLAPALLREMGAAFPELVRAESLITETLKHEEDRFRDTLGRGLKVLDEYLAALPEGEALPGEQAFVLYDTYGFPLDLTQDILRGQGRGVEVEAFHACMEEQKARARAAWKGSGEAATEDLWFHLRKTHGATEFLGYTHDNADARILALVKDGAVVEEAAEGERVAILTHQTPFYGESGGQIGDIGWMDIERHGIVEGRITVEDTQKPLPDLLVHHGVIARACKTEPHGIRTGDIAKLRIDTPRRTAIRANHSATHLLHAALRRCLGEHITQKGSLVAPDRLRFDISHPKAVTRAELAAVEAEVNAMIRQNTEASTRIMTPKAAITAGALALFGEKYGDEVRVLTMGRDADDHDYSVELCGGTHVARTGDIGVFKILSESAVAAGVRRLEAVTGTAALDYLNTQESRVHDLADTLKTGMERVPERVEALQAELKSAHKEIGILKKKLATSGGSNGQSAIQPETVGDITLVRHCFDGLPPKELRDIAQELLHKHAPAVIAVGTAVDGKASLIVAVSPDLTARYNAGELVNTGAEAIGGRGGGKPGMAQAGGQDVAALPAALDLIARTLQEKTAA